VIPLGFRLDVPHLRHIGIISGLPITRLVPSTQTADFRPSIGRGRWSDELCHEFSYIGLIVQKVNCQVGPYASNTSSKRL
jgi:hypothetical protein